MNTQSILTGIAILILLYAIYRYYESENFAEIKHHEPKHHELKHHEVKHHVPNHHEGKMIHHSELKHQETIPAITCRNMTTAFDQDGGGNSVYLDRQNVSCWNNENLSGFRLLRNYNSGMNKINYNYKCCNQYDNPNKESQWQCLNDIWSPIRKNKNGDIECASIDGKDCLWQNSLNDCKQLINNMPTNLDPLSCGEKHKQYYGVTGYDSTPHWCSQGYNELVSQGL